MSISTILLLLMVVGISMYSKLNKTIVAQSVPSDDSADDVQEDTEYFMNEEESFSPQENPYFSYETEAPQAPICEKRKPKPQPVYMAVAEEPVRPQFDLRQAVIGQMILTNNYINELNQQNQ